MRKLFRLFRRIGAVASTALSTLRQYRQISRRFKDDKHGFIQASATLSNKAMSRIKDAGGVELVFNGAAIHKGPVIYVANHISFMDAPMIGSLVNTSFVSKKETGEQPFIGPMLRAMSTTFIERTSEDLPRARQEMARKLRDGRNIMFFPEATTTDGSFVLPFRAGLLSMLFNEEARHDKKLRLPEDLRLQGFTIRLTHINGIDVEKDRAATQHLRDIFTNHIGTPNGVIQEMLHTFRYMMHVEHARVEITAHEPLNPYEFEDGKALINAAKEQITPLIRDNVAPNVELFEKYRHGRPGWKAPKPELMKL